MDLMNFESSQVPDMLGPLLVEKALDDFPVFGPDRPGLDLVIEQATSSAASSGLVEDFDASARPLPKAFTNASTTAEKLRALRTYVKDNDTPKYVDDVTESTADLSLSATGPPTNHQLHEELLSTLVLADGLPREARAVVDHSMLLRAKEKYLFDPSINRAVVDDDPWLRYIWGWISGELLVPPMILLTGADSYAQMPKWRTRTAA